MTTATQTVDLERDARIESIRCAAAVRRQLTQAADYRRLDNGTHEITLFDHAAGRLRIFRSKTLAAAIGKARQA
jgi:hypothetical protein